MIGYAQLRPGPGFEFRRAVPYYAQRIVTWRRLRGPVSRGIAAAIRLRHGAGTEGQDGPAVRPALLDLRRDGLATLGDLVPPAMAKRMLAYFLGQRVARPGGRLVRLEEVEAGASMAAYPLSAVVACPGLMEAINAPDILRIAAGYVGCKPTISSLGVRWSFPSAVKREETQLFHRDPDDWRFLKLFVYLTDVEPDAGPHVFVCGSHETAARLRAQPYERAALEREYGAARIRSITGPAGTTFMADTHGIHMGQPPARAARLILQVQYSLLPIFAFHYEPVPVALPRGLDPYVNRLMVAEHAAEAASIGSLAEEEEAARAG